VINPGSPTASRSRRTSSSRPTIVDSGRGNRPDSRRPAAASRGASSPEMIVSYTLALGVYRRGAPVVAAAS
jgi:hypothetical protein